VRGEWLLEIALLLHQSRCFAEVTSQMHVVPGLSYTANSKYRQ
jgi:hypothetical protein